MRRSGASNEGRKSGVAGPGVEQGGTVAPRDVPTGRATATSIVMPPGVALWPIERLRPYERNPRTHSAEQITKIAASMVEFGFTNPVLVDRDAGIIAGHGRLLAAKQLGLDSVPVIELAHLTPEQRRAYVIADNALALAAGWDEELLAAELKALDDLDFDLALTGLDDAEIESLLDVGEVAEEEAAPEPPEVPVSRTGDLWIMGPHRLLVGDATNASDVARVLNGETPRLLVTDPPYGVALDMEWRDRAGFNSVTAPAEPSYMRRTDGHRNTTISGDTKADWSDAFELVPSLDTAYVWHASAHAIEVGLGLRRIGFEIKQQIIWRKPRLVMSRQHYHWQHEPCWYARKPDALPFRGSKDQTTIWDAASPKMPFGRDSEAEEALDHPTQKAIVLCTRPILNHLSRGEWVYDPFAGSGTTLAAADTTERRCITIEIDPRYADVAILRWQKATGAVAMLDGTCKMFAEIAAERSVVVAAVVE